MTWDRGTGILPTTHRRMTAGEYYRLPEGPPYFQLIDGELFMSPSPNFFHQKLVVRLVTSIEVYLQRNPIGEVVVSPSDVQFDIGNVYQPDVFFIGNERLHIVDEHGAKGAPDLVIEVISPGTSRLDLGPKKQIYATFGVIEFWAVYPETSKVEIFRLQESLTIPAHVLQAGDTLSTLVLPEWKLPASDLFAR